MHKIDRRKLIVSGAIRAAALSVGAAPHRKKWVWRPIIGTREALLVAAFNASPPDDDDYFLGDQPFDSTLREMIGVPARSAEDALAAVEFKRRGGRPFRA